MKRMIVLASGSSSNQKAMIAFCLSSFLFGIVWVQHQHLYSMYANMASNAGFMGIRDLTGLVVQSRLNNEGIQVIKLQNDEGEVRTVFIMPSLGGLPSRIRVGDRISVKSVKSKDKNPPLYYPVSAANVRRIAN